VRLKECRWAFRQAIRNGDAAERALGSERFHSIIGEMAANDFPMPSLRRLLIGHARIGMTFHKPRKLAAHRHDQFILSSSTAAR
jgi:DNA-binding GntR family transcriptional regulator